MRWMLACVLGSIVAFLPACKGGGTSADDPSAAAGSASWFALREQAISRLQELARSADPLTRANALEALELAPEALDRVAASGLLDENVGVRSIAAVAVGRAGLTKHAAILEGMLADESPYARASAVFALAKLGVDVNQSILAEFLLRGEPAGLRGHTAYLLGELSEPSAIDLLRDGADAPMRLASAAERRVVELQISEAMVKLGDRSQLEPIRAALFPSQPGDLEAMALAVQIVGEVGDRASRGRLVQIAETTDDSGRPMPPEVQLAIAISMGKLGDRNGWFVADRFWDDDRDVLRADAAAVYGWTAREQDIRRLSEMLQDRSGRVRVLAAAGILRATGGLAGS